MKNIIIVVIVVVCSHLLTLKYANYLITEFEYVIFLIDFVAAFLTLVVIDLLKIAKR